MNLLGGCKYKIYNMTLVPFYTVKWFWRGRFKCLTLTDRRTDRPTTRQVIRRFQVSRRSMWCRRIGWQLCCYLCNRSFKFGWLNLFDLMKSSYKACCHNDCATASSLCIIYMLHVLIVIKSQNFDPIVRFRKYSL